MAQTSSHHTVGLFEQLLQFAPDGLVGVDVDGRIVLVNAQAEALFGYSESELVGQQVELLVPERYRDSHPEHRLAYFADPCTRPMGAKLDLFGRRKDGSEFPAEISLSGITSDDGVLAIAAIRDVTERFQAQRKFAQFVELAPDGIVGVGEDGRIMLVNEQTERLFGYSREQLVGSKVELLVPERFRAAHPEHRANYFASPRTRPMGAGLELFARRRDGSEFPAEISLSSIETEDGVLALAAIRDISERRQVEREKQMLETELAESRRLDAERERHAMEAQLNQLRRLESVGQLAGGIAHDFNNILGVIINYALFVAEELPPGSAAHEDVEEIRRAAERATALTRQLLIFSRRDVVRPQVLDLNEVVSELDRLLRRALGEHIELETRFADALWSVEADPGQIEQVLVNLAVNARDAMPTGGKLILETTNVTLDREFCEIEPSASPGCYVRLSVSDTGAGMSPAVIAHAFEPFYTTKPRGEGTGLGLTTVYGIVTEAGGSVHISSEPELGTSVKVHLPVTDHAPSPRDQARAGAPAGGAETILVVEDADSVRRLTERILTQAGYTVLLAETGSVALELLARPDQPIDLLLTDVIMPEMLGTELAARAAEVRPGLRVLHMSGYIDQAISKLDQGGVAFVEKPFTVETLCRGVRAALDGGRDG